MKYNIDFNNITDSHWWDSNLTTAIIALIGVIASVVITYYTNKKAAERDKKAQKELQDRLLETQGNNEKEAIEARQEFEEKLAKSQQAFEERMTKIQIDANLRASARIKWIQKVREASSSFLSSVLKLKGLTNERIGSINPQTSKELDDKIIDELNQFQEKRLLLKLYFGTNTENNKVVDDIENINTIVSQFIESQQTDTLNQNNYESSMKDIDENVDTFNENMRKYLKVEWDRAKKGE